MYNHITTLQYMMCTLYPCGRVRGSTRMRGTTLRASSQSDAQIYYKKSRGFLDDLTQERNAGKRKDRIRVYPSVVLRFYKRRREDDATQRIV